MSLNLKKKGCHSNTSFDGTSDREKTNEESSVSEDDIFFKPSKRGSMNTLSDYETGDSSGTAVESTHFNFDVNNDLSQSVLNENETFSSLNDNDDDGWKILSKKKRKRTHNYLSTSDSSDTDTPIQSQSIRKRVKITSSSEESDRESSNFVQTRRNGMFERINMFVENTTSSYQRRQINREIQNNSSCNQRRRQTGRHRRFRSGIQGGRSASSSEDDISIGSDSSDPTFVSEIDNNIRSRLRSNTRQRVLENGNELNITQNSFTLSRYCRRPQIHSSSSSSSDSDTSIFTSNARRRGVFIPIHESSDDNSDDIPHILTSSVATNATSNSIRNHYRSLSDSDEESEKCPICLVRFSEQEVGSPGSCDHSFCTFCIEEWAKNSNTCPVDRKPFDKIIVRSKFKGEVIREIQVQPATANFSDNFTVDFFVEFRFIESPDYEPDDEVCYICRRGNQYSNFIQCDNCYYAYHLTCLNPPLRNIPVEDWICPSCVENEISYSEDSDDSNSNIWN